MDNKIHIDVYCNCNNKILKVIRKISRDLNAYVFSYYDIDESPPPVKEIGSIVIFEESSVDEPFIKFSRIYKSYISSPFVIITSEKPYYTNAVKWMKNYAVDYLDANLDYSPEEFNKILSEAIILDPMSFDESDFAETDAFSFQPVSMEADVVWNELEDDTDYQMSILMASIIIKDDFLSKYSKEQIDDIADKMEYYMTKRATNMGGYKLFWNNNNGAYLFYFGDRINLSALACISILNKIKIYCIERLGIEDSFDIKLTLHDGNIIFSKKETKFISSDAINTVAHLKNLNINNNTLDITENIYNYLNPRLKHLFNKDKTFEGRQIYTYYLDFYNIKPFN